MKELFDRRLSRKRFLALLGASTALATGCSRKGRGLALPYTKKPRLTPGVAERYAGTFQEGLEAYSVLVKTREGRPIHIEGNDKHPSLRGKTSLRAIADVLRLYDPDRLRRPILDRKAASWEQAQTRILSGLKAAKAERKPILLLSNALLSPSRKALLAELRNALPGLSHAAWEPALGESEAEALAACFGDARRPRLRLDKAKAVVCFEAGILGADHPQEIAGFAAGRAPAGAEGPMNRLYVFEGGMSLAGANADHRCAWRPSRAAALAFALARQLHQKGVPLPSGVDPAALAPFDIDALAREQGADPALLRGLADDLKKAGGLSLAIAGPSLPAQAHAASHLLNYMLGAHGRTVDWASSTQPEALASLAGLRRLLSDAAAGRFAAAIFWGINPAYSFPDHELWKSAAAAVPLRIRIGLHVDETAQDCQVILPENHWLESWGDYESSSDLLCLQQPAVEPLYDTKQGEDVLLGMLNGLGGKAPSSYREYLMRRWGKGADAALHDGVVLWPRSAPRARSLNGHAVNQAAKKAGTKPALSTSAFELILAPAAGVHDGRYANSGWLQELPEPMTKLTWGNAASISPQDAERLSLENGDVVRLEAGSLSVAVPIVIQPGQAPGVLSASLGYGRRTGSVARGVGVNLFPLLASESEARLLKLGVTIVRTRDRRTLLFAQRHDSMEGRDVARSFSLAEYAGRKPEPRPDPATLYPPQKFPKHKWAMAVDLSACVGCEACVIACQSENNIPTVGPERVARGREMHWMRVDRYYLGGPRDARARFQPMLCQQCDDAPCETVCPVAATTHSDEGLNQMAYNRCVGTRYCQNNCPYKVRRFNFFEYAAELQAPADLVFNPEVSVRPRGVMEKCTFCIQRIQEAKQLAKAAGRDLREGDIEPACAAACPARAIVFGDLRDPSSRVSRLAQSDRSYRLLEEIGARPSVFYLFDLTNPREAHG